MDRNCFDLLSTLLSLVFICSWTEFLLPKWGRHFLLGQWLKAALQTPVSS